MSGCGHHLAQQLQPLCANLGIEKIDTCQVAARPGEAGDEADRDRVSGNGKDNRDRRGRRLGRKRATRDRDDRGDLSTSQVGRQRWKPIDLIVRPAVFDRYVLALDMTGFLQTLAKCRADGPRSCRATRCAGTRSPASPAAAPAPRAATPRRAAEQRDELAPSHSITSSARASSGRRHFEAERLGGLEIDHELELGRRPAPAGRRASRP